MAADIQTRYHMIEGLNIAEVARIVHNVVQHPHSYKTVTEKKKL